MRSSALKDKCSQSCSVCFLKQREQKIDISEQPVQNEYLCKI